MRRFRDRDDDDETTTFVIETRGGDGGVEAFLFGVLVGAAAALLLAPRSGAETQAEIAGAVRRARDQVEGRVNEVREGVTGRVEGVRGRFSRGVETVRGGVETQVGRARAAVDAGRHAAADAREELRRRVDEAKTAYRASRGSPNGDGAPASSTEVTILETTTETDAGDLADDRG
jgi:gas vesicle protein